MGWNGRSWLLSDALHGGTVLSLASVLYVLIALGFVAGGVGHVLRQGWSPMVLVVVAVLSSVLIVVMWDGRPELLVEKVVLGVLMNAAVVFPLVLR